MSVPVLIQTYDEVRRLAIAGSVVAAGGFRLEKLVPPLKQAGQKAPVFAKVAEAVERLAKSNEQTSAAALLELASLVNSILYTQGETGAEGELTPLSTVTLGRPQTKASARVLKPLCEALTTKGSGRLEIVRDGFERGLFRDLRLVAPALAALDDNYPDVADLVADDILPLYGPAIVPELQATFDPRGKSGHVRRLLLMHRLDPEAARPFVLRSLEEGSSDVRVAAIDCLGELPDDLPFLLEHVKSRTKDVRVAALRALGRSRTDEAARVLCDVIHREDLALAVEPLQESCHPAVTSTLLDEAEKQFDILIVGKEKDPNKLGPQNERLRLLLNCLEERRDSRTGKLLLAMFGQVTRLAAIKGTPSGKDVIEQLLSTMADAAPSVQSALIDARETLPAESLKHAFDAALNSRKPAEVFALFSPYLTAAVSEKKSKRDPVWLKREAIIDKLIDVRHWEEFGAEERGITTELDPRWLELAVKLGRFDLVEALVVRGQTAANEFLATFFWQTVGNKGADENELIEVVKTMVRLDHPGATDAVVELIKKLAKSRSPSVTFYLSYDVSPMIPRLPRAEALPKLEALLPTLPEWTTDKLLDHVAELKQGTPTATST